jgi:CRISPR-associated endonuclease/helicase Cas3
MVYAHSPNNVGQSHDLIAHLKSVAEKAAEFAGKFGAADFGYWAGLWHDLGKFHPDFQEYLKAQVEGSFASDRSGEYSITAF